MATSPKQSNTTNNIQQGKRKKSRVTKGSYLSKWLDRSMSHIQTATPSMDTYDPYANTSCPPSKAQFTPGYDPYRFNYGCSQEPTSLPIMPSYWNPAVPFHSPEYRYIESVNKSVQVQRPRRRRSELKAEDIHTPNSTPGNNYLESQNLMDSQDFTSLPPIVTSVGDTNSNSEVNEKEDGNNNRRFSDPCVRGLPDVARPGNGDAETGSESSEASESQIGSRLLTCLLDQISNLKIVNERLNKDLMDTKVELENVRHQNAMLQKGIPSMAGTPNHSPLNSNGYMGPYSPGFITDVVREIRDGARVREEAHYARVRAMIIDRNESSMASSEAKFVEKSLEDIKSSLRASEADKRRMMDRIVKMEEEIRFMRISNGIESNESKLTNGNVEDAETECLRLRREIAEMRKSKQNAEEHSLKLERLVTQLRSKFNGVQISNGPESLTSANESENETSGRARRASTNSSGNCTLVFGPVTDL